MTVVEEGLFTYFNEGMKYNLLMISLFNGQQYWYIAMFTN